MVVDQIDFISIAIVEAKYKTPIAGNHDRPQACKIAFQRMQPVSWQIHVFSLIGFVQARKNPFKLVCILWLHLPAVPLLEEKAKTFVPEAKDHRLTLQALLIAS